MSTISNSTTQQAAAQRELDLYVLPDDLRYRSHRPWNTSDRLDFQCFVDATYLGTGETACDSGRIKLDFHVKFDESGAVTDAYAHDMGRNVVGHRGQPRAQRELTDLEKVLIQAIEASGFSVSGPSSLLAAEDGEPAWVCNARGVLAVARSQPDHIASVELVIPGLAPEFVNEQSYTAAMRVARIGQTLKAWHVLDESPGASTDGSASDEQAVVCVLADLRHYCDTNGLDYALLDKHAYRDYLDQLENDRQSRTSGRAAPAPSDK